MSLDLVSKRRLLRLGLPTYFVGLICCSCMAERYEAVIVPVAAGLGLAFTVWLIFGRKR